MRKTMLCRLAAAALATLLGCAHGSPDFAVGPCPEEEEMKPRVSTFCGAHRSGRRYTKGVHRAVLMSGNQGIGDGFSGMVAVSFGEGPKVESVCHAGFGPEFTEEELDRMAWRVGHVLVPSALECFAGRRFEMHLAPEVEGPPPAVPESWRKL